MDSKALFTQFTQVITQEADALHRTASLIKEDDVKALISIFEYLTQNNGRLVFSGVGKSGHIGVKLVATFASLALPSTFLHATEAMHGDLGQVTKNDALVLISKSGTTEEIIKMLPYITLPKERIIAIVGDITSPIALKAGVILNASVEREACINNLAPTTSTTVALAVGDAMAVVYETVFKVTKEKFASNHPGGLLGKALYLTVDHVLVKGSECPSVNGSASFQDALLAMAHRPVGICAVLDGQKLLGVVVEDDIRRAFEKGGDVIKAPVKEVMTEKPVSVTSNTLAAQALKLMESQAKMLTALPIVDGDNFVGVLRLEDLFKAGFHSSVAHKK